MKAVLCPVCNGKGRIYGGYESGTEPLETCHGCGGKGWVEVHEESCCSYPMALLTLYPDNITGQVYHEPNS